MKKLIFFLSSFLIGLASFAQSPISLESSALANRVYEPEYFPEVKGKLLNYDPESHKDIHIKYVAVQMGSEMQATRMATLNSDGSFELEFDYGFPYQQIWFFIGEQYYGQIFANKDLFIEADLDKLGGKKLYWYGEGIKFSGTDAALNVYGNKYIKFRQKKEGNLSKKSFEIPRDKDLELDEKILKMKEISEEYAAIEDLFIQKEGDSYAWVLENDRLSNLYGELCLLHSRKEMDADLKAEILAHQPKVLSNESYLYYKYIGMMLNGRKTDEFLEKMQSFPSAKSALVKLMAQPDDIYARKEFLKKVLPAMEDHWAKDHMQRNLEADEKRITEIEESIKNSSQKEVQSDLGTKLMDLGANTHLYSSNEESPEELIKSLRAAYPGKALILDVWTIWCGPCLADMKDSQSIKKDLKELPLEIIYLNVDQHSPQKKWQKKIAELEVEGQHIFLENKLGTALMEYFKFSGYPSYVFIDKEGKVDLTYIHRISDIDVEDLKKKL